jgi:hypothetical protein
VSLVNIVGGIGLPFSALHRELTGDGQMEPTATMSASPGPTLKPEPAPVRARELAAARRRATALLVGVTVLFLAVTAVGVHGTLLGYVQAGAEASMVGGVADWFAVTALFRRPLGLPIPHTALIVERKDSSFRRTSSTPMFLPSGSAPPASLPAWPPGWPTRPMPPVSPVAPPIWRSRWPRLSAMRMSSACSPPN